MFQTVSMWNMIRPDLEMKESVQSITRRGYNSDPAARVFLTGEFAAKIVDQTIKPLSVGDVADRQCPTRRDVYFKKGVGSRRERGVSTWGRVAGGIVERYVMGLFNEGMNKRRKRSYRGLRKASSDYSHTFGTSNQSAINTLSRLRTQVYEDPVWLIRILKTCGGAELGSKLLHSVIINPENDIDINQLELNTTSSLQLRPRPKEVGISRGVEPDFLIKRCKVIGDIKSGIRFEEYYLLTCAGYALAYENEKGEGNEIDWGVIYFIPTRYPTHYVRPITCAQVYIFPIDDDLRRWFLDFRNQDYSIISSSTPPELPDRDARQHCPYCKFKECCQRDGLPI